jgi:hypothetical protein
MQMEQGIHCARDGDGMDAVQSDRADRRRIQPRRRATRAIVGADLTIGSCVNVEGVAAQPRVLGFDHGQSGAGGNRRIRRRTAFAQDVQPHARGIGMRCGDHGAVGKGRRPARSLKVAHQQ